MCVSPQRRAIFRHLNFKKVLQTWGVLYIFTYECAFRHSGVQFFDIRTSKNAPNMRCFVHFHLRMCVSPQRRAIFRHQNFKKCSKHEVFCTFSLTNVRFATAACNFSTSDLQKVLRTWGVLYILTSKCAFRHSGVQFLISLLSTYLRTRRFNRPTFGLTRHTDHWKNTAFRDFSNIWRGGYLLSSDFRTIASSFCWLDYSTTVLFICFSTLHIVGSFYLNFLRLVDHASWSETWHHLFGILLELRGWPWEPLLDQNKTGCLTLSCLAWGKTIKDPFYPGGINFLGILYREQNWFQPTTKPNYDPFYQWSLQSLQMILF